MDMDQAAVFLAGTILTALGFLVILMAIVIANNIIHCWWKPLGWTFGWIAAPTRFPTPEELEQSSKIEPVIDKKNEPKATTN
jgi:hypothetical protein